MREHRKLSLGSLLLVGLATATADTPSAPIAPAELGDGPIDEVAQLAKMRVALKHHYHADNEDTRFVVDRNDKGIFRMMQNVGLVHFPADDDPNETRIGTGTLLDGCFVLTSYHVVEGREVIEGDKVPLKDREVRFSYGSVVGQTNGFQFRSLPGIVVDPGILNLAGKNFNIKRWSDDMVLIRLSRRIDAVNPNFELGHIFEKQLPTKPWLMSDSRFAVAGYPGDWVEKYRRFDLRVDFCNVLGASPNAGAATNCVITPGMSGGPLLYWQSASGQEVRPLLVGMAFFSGSGRGLFGKQSGGSSLVAPLTPIKIAKIKAIIDRPTDDQCQPTDGKPW